MPDIVFMDMDGNEIRKDITDINSLDDVKKSFKELDKKKGQKKWTSIVITLMYLLCLLRLH